MSDSYTPPTGGPPPRPMPPAKPSSGGRTCLIAGLLGCGGFLTLAIILGIVGFFVGKSMLAGIIEEYTDTEPMELPAVSLSDEQLEEVAARIDSFSDALENGSATEPLVLTGDEINAWFAAEAASQGAQDFNPADHIYVVIEDDRLKGQITFPLYDFVQFDVFKGRHFNGSGEFSVSLTQGVLVVKALALEYRGKPLPAEMMKEIGNENLAEEFVKDPEAVAFFSKLDAIDVRDGRMIIVPKGAELPAAVESEPAEEPGEPEVPAAEEPEQPAEAAATAEQ